jgi:hypothetical protein
LNHQKWPRAQIILQVTGFCSLGERVLFVQCAGQETPANPASFLEWKNRHETKCSILSRLGRHTRCPGVTEQKIHLSNAKNFELISALGVFQNNKALWTLQKLTFLQIRPPYSFSRVFELQNLVAKVVSFAKAFANRSKRSYFRPKYP